MSRSVFLWLLSLQRLRILGFNLRNIAKNLDLGGIGSPHAIHSFYKEQKIVEKLVDQKNKKLYLSRESVDEDYHRSYPDFLFFFGVGEEGEALCDSRKGFSSCFNI